MMSLISRGCVCASDQVSILKVVRRQPGLADREVSSGALRSAVCLVAGSRQPGGALALGLSLFRSRGSVAMAASVSEVEQVLQQPQWPEKSPYSAKDFERFDESSDTIFYNSPRFVTHIDDHAIAALTKYYGEVLPPSGTADAAVLDLCSSWISHYPKGYQAGKITGLGMNEAELSRNEVLTDYVVHDLNVDAALPFEDNTYDVITNTVSVDYLSKPMEVFKEMHRVLKPGGLAVMSFSNRCFPTKAIAIWTSTGDADHAWIVGSYFHYSVPGGWTDPAAKDISPKPSFFGKTDPMYVVFARKKDA
ncbi:hypothetical protein WJX72_012561 [[Myrmecia] bisecta]|uniref:Methyltransferase type 11 domain-containing protein n=1 Tax=[Myrmecia] bisecta TaxID=41462 RepID=A0AAW1QA87_9CHLO